MDRPKLENVKTETLVIILLGPPGAGKGSQAAFIREKLNIPHISSGNLLRENIAQNTELGQKAKGYMEKGRLVPSELIFDMVFDRIEKPDCEKGYILDGFPRTIDQALSFQKRLDSNTKCKAINLSLADCVIIDRLTKRRICEKCHAPYNLKFFPPKNAGKCDRCQGDLFQRNDDKKEVVEKRLSVYNQETTPLISFYKQKDTLHTIDANSSKDALLVQILQALA